MSVLGTFVLRREDEPLLTGRAAFVADLPAAGLAHVAFVRSIEAHAELVAVHTEEAEAAPGVFGVWTAATLTMAPQPPAAPFISEAMARPALAAGRVRFVGEPVAVVVAESPAMAADAAEMVWIETVPLEPVVDLATAADSDSLLFPGAGTNVMAARGPSADVDPLEGADVVVERAVVNQRMSCASIEPRVIAASWDGERLTVDASTQGGFQARSDYAAALGLDEGAVRVRYRDVGGGFGSKTVPSIEEKVVCWLAIETGLPVRWAESRSENLQSFAHGRAQVLSLRLGATSDGELVGITGEVLQDGGAYPMVASVLPRLTARMICGCYDIPAAAVGWRSVATNTAPVGAFRGAGRPEAAYAIERMMDALAHELEVDPIELRRANFILPDAFPFTTASGATYDSGEYGLALDRAADLIGYQSIRAEQAKRRADGDALLLGVGVASYVEITAGPVHADGIDVELRPDGRFTVRTGTAPMGQGHLTTWAMIAADELGVPMDLIDVESGDTDTMPKGPIVGGSRSVQSVGAALVHASRELVALARLNGAELLEAAVDDIVFDSAVGGFHVRGTPAVTVAWADLAAARDDPLVVAFESEPHDGSYPSGAHAAVVEVDAETGAVTLKRFVAVDDCGTVINPAMVAGQVHGGIGGGVGQALFEEIVYDEAGTPRTGTFLDYGIASAADYPSFECETLETPSPNNVLGAKGIGESGTTGSTPAVANAVIDALSHLGVTDLDMPFTPQTVWRAISKARSSSRQP